MRCRVSGIVVHSMEQYVQKMSTIQQTLGLVKILMLVIQQNKEIILLKKCKNKLDVFTRKVIVGIIILNMDSRKTQREKFCTLHKYQIFANPLPRHDVIHKEKIIFAKSLYLLVFQAFPVTCFREFRIEIYNRIKDFYLYHFVIVTSFWSKSQVKTHDKWFWCPYNRYTSYSTL